jgi:simple sugar transport system permease protein
MGSFLAALGDVLGADITYASAMRFTAFLMFIAVGEWVAERAGTINISVEAMALGGAFAAAVGQDATGSIWIGLAASAAAGLLVASIQANMSHRLPADQFVVGLTLNILVLGLVSFLASELEPVNNAASAVEIPVLAAIPLIGPALFGQPWTLYLLYPLVPLGWWLVYRTRWGLELRSIGEDPNAADVSGLHVNRRRRQAVYVAGITSGLGGGYLLLGQVGTFEDSMTGYRGFIAIAAVIFGGWTLKGTIGGCLLFGLAISFKQNLPQQGYDAIPEEVLNALPYVLALGAMAVFAARVRQPSALARPFIRGLK